MLTKLKFKLFAITLLLSLLPFASIFACPCDGTSDTSYLGQVQATDSQSVNGTLTSVTTTTTTTSTDDSNNTDAPPYNNYPN